MNKIFKNEKSLLGKLETFFWRLYDKEVFRFLIASGINTLLGMICSIFISLILEYYKIINKLDIFSIGTFKVELDIANAISFIVLLPVAYTLQSLIAFKARWRLKRLLIYPISSIPNLVLQQFFIWIFNNQLKVPNTIAYILAPICALPIMFFIIKILVQPFKGNPNKKLKQIRYIFCDIDGTLINSDSKLAKETIDSVKRIKDNYKFYLISGRHYEGMKDFYQTLELDTPLITENGANIVSADGKKIYQCCLDNTLALTIINFINTFSAVSLNVYADNIWYANKQNEYTKFEETIVGKKANIIKDFQNLTNISKIMVIASDELIKSMYKFLRKNFKKQCKIVHSKHNYIEISHLNVNKGTAIKKLKLENNWKKKEIMALGDSITDEPMFDCVGFAVAVKNGNDGLRHIANFVTDSNDNLGVKNVLNKLP